jgi:hypothetical protein
MTTLIDIYLSNKDFFVEKKLQNIIALCGDGKLRDNSTASDQFRGLLNIIPSELLIKYCRECLNESFSDGGIALQDIINQMGIRLNYEVEHGLYQGKRNAVGFDGIWKGKDGHSLIIESKTTDAYRINLDTLGTYRRKLIEVDIVNSSASILIIVGRQDTGDLEAQIRGSKHAWDIRVISTEAIIDLMNMRETVDDFKILQQINEVLKPLEYTRLDTLVKLLYLTSKDQNEDDSPTDSEDVVSGEIDPKEEIVKKAPMNYHDQCIEKLSEILNKTFVKQSKSMYRGMDKNTGISISVSKAYVSGNSISYWYAYHPYQDDFLNDFENGFACFSCGSADTIIIIPIHEFTKMKDNFTCTFKGEKMYWHVWIFKNGNSFELGQSKNSSLKRINIDKYINRIN